MDYTVLMKTRRLKRVAGRSETTQEVYDGRIRLNDLPDEILLHILSYLPTKYAVRTSALSRRWKNLWIYLPKIRFHGDCPSAERVLALRAHHQLSSLNKFSIENFPVRNNVSRIEPLITAALSYNVQDLNLSLEQLDHSYASPDCVCTCKTLVEFCLGLECGTILRIPSSVRLPNLKVLSLWQVQFEVGEDGASSVEKLFSCPSLKKLSIRSCSWIDVEHLRISAPKLTELTIEDNWEHHSCQVLIDGSSLLYFKYYGEPCSEYSIVGTSMELNSEIKVDYGIRSDTIVYQLLSSLSSVKVLNLGENFLEELAQRDNLEELLDALPEFGNLTEMKVEMLGYREEWMVLMGILRKCHCLQSLKLILHMEMDDYIEEVYSYCNPSPVPLCFLTQLQTIKLVGGDRLDAVFHIAKIFLKKAMVLEEMILHSPIIVWSNADFLKDLRKLPRCSQKCRISLVNSLGKVTLAA